MEAQLVALQDGLAEAQPQSKARRGSHVAACCIELDAAASSWMSVGGGVVPRRANDSTGSPKIVVVLDFQKRIELQVTDGFQRTRWSHSSQFFQSRLEDGWRFCFRWIFQFTRAVPRRSVGWAQGEFGLLIERLPHVRVAEHDLTGENLRTLTKESPRDRKADPRPSSITLVAALPLLVPLLAPGALAVPSTAPFPRWP